MSLSTNYRGQARLAAYVLPLTLMACSGGDTGNSANGNIADPAISGALGDQIMVDPQLSRQANSDAIRPPGQPYSGGVPADGVATNNGKLEVGELLRTPAPTKFSRDPNAGGVTLGALAEQQKHGGMAKCHASLKYSANWATRMPRDLPLYPQARITEAAGSDTDGCTLRVLTFSSAQPLQGVLDYYYTRATKGGYSSEHQLDGQEHVLGGTRKRDGAVYILFLRKRGDGGTDADLIADMGV